MTKSQIETKQISITKSQKTTIIKCVVHFGWDLFCWDLKNWDLVIGIYLVSVWVLSLNTCRYIKQYFVNFSLNKRPVKAAFNIKH
jgi:hypothetical protein